MCSTLQRSTPGRNQSKQYRTRTENLFLERKVLTYHGTPSMSAILRSSATAIQFNVKLPRNVTARDLHCSKQTQSTLRATNPSKRKRAPHRDVCTFTGSKNTTAMDIRMLVRIPQNTRHHFRLPRRCNARGHRGIQNV